MPSSRPSGGPPRKKGPGKKNFTRSGDSAGDSQRRPARGAKPFRKSEGPASGGQRRSFGTSPKDDRDDSKRPSSRGRVPGKKNFTRSGDSTGYPQRRPARDAKPFRKSEGPASGGQRRSFGTSPKDDRDDSKRPSSGGRFPGKERDWKAGDVDRPRKPGYSGKARRPDNADRPRGVARKSSAGGIRRTRDENRSESHGFENREHKKFDRGGVKRGGKSLRGAEPETPKTGPIRLNKYIANSGVCSRREADDLITMGLITVNGTVVTTLGYKVNPGDEVRHEGRILRAEKPVYILLNKPKGFLTTTDDPQERSTVMSLVKGVVKERIYPVGRLDRNTTGLLLLTNDGELADHLMHPSYNVKKIYRVELDRPLTKADANKIIEGVHLEEGKAVVDDLAIISDDKKTVGLEIHIGWNRVVRRIFEALEYNVVKLDRSVYAGLTKKDLGRGEWRFLKPDEIVVLKHFKK